MSKKDKIKIEERTGFAKIKHDFIMWSTFFAPPTVIFIAWYYFTRELLISITGTAVCIVLGIIALAAWYMRKGKGGEVVAPE